MKDTNGSREIYKVHKSVSHCLKTVTVAVIILKEKLHAVIGFKRGRVVESR